ncbi:MAG: hypothetical protein ACON5B_05415 [Myxococcota bacterium]
MYTQFRQRLLSPPALFQRHSYRFALLHRIKRALGRRNLPWLAFGIGDDEIRLVIECSSPDAMDAYNRVFRAGESRVLNQNTEGRVMTWCDELTQTDDLLEAVQWAHAVALPAHAPPHTTPWSSYRDLMGLRFAGFFNPEVTRARLDTRELEFGGHHPSIGQPATRRPGLQTILVQVAHVLGVSNHDRRAFGLFAQVGRRLGFRPKMLADALLLTTRRIRQLNARPHPHLHDAMTVIEQARVDA